MGKHIIRVTAVFFTALTVSLTSADSGGAPDKDEITIVTDSKRSTEAEKFAALELKQHLDKVTGQKIQITDTAPAKGRKIYLGPAGLAKLGENAPGDLSEEDWLIKSSGDDLVLTGGRPRGTVYAVYEFLERAAGCRWLDEETSVIPQNSGLSWGKLDSRGKPSFFLRDLASPLWNDTQKSISFLARNKYNSAYLGAQYGFTERYGAPGGCHTFYEYSKDWPADHPEYFSLQAGGKRLKAVNSTGPGQICLTNPEVRKLVLEKLRKYIKSDRERAAKTGAPPPRVYDISHNDNADKCVCPQCSALAEKYGAYSGVMLDFINDIAGKIKTEYPDIYIQTFAYTFTIKPPRNIRPAENVIVRVCNLGMEFPGEGISEPARPLTDPVNQKFMDCLKGWAEMSRAISAWDYWKIYMKPFTWPYINLDKIYGDLKTFRGMRVRGMLVENEGFPMPTSFYPLKRWLSLKLMDNPDADGKKLTDEFMKGYYGPAAPEMTELLGYLDRTTKAEPVSMATVLPFQLSYLRDEVFYQKYYGLLDSAEKKCAGSPLFLRHARQERVMADSALLHMWGTLVKKLGRGPAFDKKAVLDRYAEGMRTLVETWGDWSQRSKETRLAAVDTAVRALSLSVPIPPEFEGKDAVDMIWVDFKEMSHMNKILDDPDAAGGKAMRINDLKDIPAHRDSDKKFHTVPFTMGVYNQRDKKFSLNFELKDIPSDEKYHLYKIGRHNFSNGTILWAHWSWYIQINADKAYDPQSPNNERDVYASIKLTGPSYVPGSTKPDAVWIDRIIAVRP